MTLTEWWQQLLVGLAGGIAGESLHWYLLARQPGGAERFRKEGVYWVTTVLMVALGGMMPILYLAGTASAVLCFHIGAATPVLLQKVVATVPAVANPMGGVGREGTRPTFRDFFRW